MTWMNELKEGELDKIFADAASKIASNRERVLFLTEFCGWSEEQIKEAVEARKGSPEDQAKVDKLVVKIVAAIRSWEEKVLAEKAAEIAEQAIEELPKQSSMGEMVEPADRLAKLERVRNAASVVLNNIVDAEGYGPKDCDGDDDPELPRDEDGDPWYHDTWELNKALRASDPGKDGTETEC